MNNHPSPSEMKALLSRPLACAPEGVVIEGRIPEGRYQNSRERHYRLYVPEGHDPQKPCSLLVMLHGCHQTHEDIQRMSGFDVLADRHQFLVLYPYVTSYVGYRARQCWGWWIRSHRTRGRGEVADIARMVDQVQLDHRIDASRVFIAGLSSGAAMAVNCLVTYPDRFVGGASVAGLAFGESAAAVRSSAFAIPRYRSEQRLYHMSRRALAGKALPPLLIVHSTDDQVVSEYATNGLEQSWRRGSGCRRTPAAWRIEGDHDDSTWSLHAYRDPGRYRLARFATSGFEHGWLGGLEGRYSNPDGPFVSGLICWFMRTVEREHAVGERAGSEDLWQVAS